MSAVHFEHFMGTDFQTHSATGAFFALHAARTLPHLDAELARLALPRRVYSMAHIDYVADRLKWLYEHRKLVGGLAFSQLMTLYLTPVVYTYLAAFLGKWNAWKARKEARKTLTPAMQAGD